MIALTLVSNAVNRSPSHSWWIGARVHHMAPAGV